MRLAKRGRESSGSSPNESYCRRLAELVFPEKVWIEGIGYTEPALKARLEADESLLDRLAALGFLKEEEAVPGKAASNDAQRAWKAAAVLEKLFPKVIRRGRRTFRRAPQDESEDLFK